MKFLQVRKDKLQQILKILSNFPLKRQTRCPNQKHIFPTESKVYRDSVSITKVEIKMLNANLKMVFSVVCVFLLTSLVQVFSQLGYKFIVLHRSRSTQEKLNTIQSQDEIFNNGGFSCTLQSSGVSWRLCSVELSIRPLSWKKGGLFMEN